MSEGDTKAPALVVSDGLTWSVRAGSDDRLGPEPHEAFLAPILQALCPEGSTFLDVGAHVGHWTVRMASWGRRVLALEPNVPTLQGLRENLRLNDLHGMVDIHAWAASDSMIGSAVLSDPNSLLAGGSTKIVDGKIGTLVETRAINTLTRLEWAKNLTCIKMDIEGHEAAALRGAQWLVAATRPNIVIEMHHPLYPDEMIEEEVSALLTTWQYVFETRIPYGACEYWVCQPSEKMNDGDPYEGS